MTIVVEDGTAKDNAESYISVADASTYHTARGNTTWAALASDALREQALRRATDYMLQAYRSKWSGRRKTTTQALDWPRYDVMLEDTSAIVADYVDNDIVPEPVKRACAEFALRAASADLLEDITPQVASESVGSISVSYVPGAKRTVTYEAMDRLLAPYLLASASGGAIRVVRA